VAVLDTDAVVLRTIRYAEADAVLSLYTRDAGRVSAIAKGARRPRSRLGGRLQPGVCARVALHRGRGELFTVRGAAVVDARAGLWVRIERLQAAACVLEAVMRVLPEDEADEEVWNLLGRALDLISREEPRDAPARLDPLVLGTHAKLLVVSGLLPVLGACAGCGASDVALPAFSATVGGALCPDCSDRGEPVEASALAGLEALVAHPLARAHEVLAPAGALGTERLIGLVLRDHLGVRLRSATPL
jgi:DNA repair protein RecO (recombination protein O)